MVGQLALNLKVVGSSRNNLPILIFMAGTQHVYLMIGFGIFLHPHKVCVIFSKPSPRISSLLPIVPRKTIVGSTLK